MNETELLKNALAHDVTSEQERNDWQAELDKALAEQARAERFGGR